VFAYVIYDGAWPTVDVLTLTTQPEGGAASSRDVILTRSVGLLTVSLGPLATGNYWLEVRLGQRRLGEPWSFQVVALPTPTPVPPTATPRPPTATPVPQQAPAPTATPVQQAPAPTATPRPPTNTPVPPQPTPTPVQPSQPTPRPGTG
jgi:hypothetical protein